MYLLFIFYINCKLIDGEFFNIFGFFVFDLIG